uniref:Mortality factor 4-like protein 2 n=1 Tax=Phascolarctos cinereus TaxID=38626 RepID=A0A6P5JJN4_PHACI|nr:mortality factor 4-like protein 2 [Phascolarctos cinereus]
MAPAKGSKVQNQPAVLDGQPVLTFHEGRMRKGECIRRDVLDKRVKYLVRYPTKSLGISASLRVSMSYLFAWAPPAPKPGPTPSGPRSCKDRSKRSLSLVAGEARPSTSSSSMFSTGYRCPVAPEWEYEWVPEGRVLCYTTMHWQKDSNAALQMAAKGLLPRERPAASSGAQGDQGSEGCPSGAPEVQLPCKHKQKSGGPSSGRGRWKGKVAAGKPEHRCLGKLEVHIRLPKALKPLLLQDWKLVTVKKKLFTLPAKKPVNAILADYIASQQNCTTAFKTYAIGELVAALQEFFDKVLGTQLLYQFEKLQHCEMLARHPRAHMSHIYGGAHLLRLFPQLGPMLACAPLGAGSLRVLRSHLQNFLKYFASDPSLLFKVATDYKVASAEYQQKAR